MNFLQLILVVRARRGCVLLLTAIVVVFALLASLAHEKSYRATTSLVLQDRADEIRHAGAAPEKRLTKHMATQIEVMRSKHVALMVVDALSLTSTASFQQAFNDAPDSAGTMRAWIAAGLLEKLDVQPASESNLVNISFNATSPDFAALTANAFAQAYLQTSVALSTGGSANSNAHTNESLKQLVMTKSAPAAVLNIAYAPLEPAGPTLWQVGLLSLLSGAMAGALIAVLAEIRDRRVRSSRDLIDALAVPVLGELKWPQPAPAIAPVSSLLQMWRLFVN